MFDTMISRLSDKTNIILTGNVLWSLLTAACTGVKSYGQSFLQEWALAWENLLYRLQLIPLKYFRDPVSHWQLSPGGRFDTSAANYQWRTRYIFIARGERRQIVQYLVSLNYYNRKTP